MKWLSRIVFALLLLGALGYGSYEIGNRILTDKLFQDSALQNGTGTAQNSASIKKSVTRQLKEKVDKPRVEVNVLDAQDAGPGPAAPSIETVEREALSQDYESRNKPNRQRVVSSSSIKAPRLPRRFYDDNADGDRQSTRRGRSSDDEDRPRRRRRRRRVEANDASSSSRPTRRRRRRRSTSSSESSRPQRRIESPQPRSESSRRESPVPVAE